MNNNITDEQILSYLLGDCEDKIRKSVEDEIKRDFEFKKKVNFLSLIQTQVKCSPVDCFVPQQRAFKIWRLIPTCTLIICSFVIGLYIESQFIFFGASTKNNHSVTTERDISKPLDWHEGKFSSLM